MLRSALSFLFTLLLLPFFGVAQDLTGIWRGWFTTDDGEQYKCEIQIGQSKSKGISGVSYSYLDTKFYGKATLTGIFRTATKSVVIQEIKTVELKMSGSSVPCIMKYTMTYSRSGNEEFLEGSFTSAYEMDAGLFKKGDPAGGGRVQLRRVVTSDFYTEPFLKKPEPRRDTVRRTPPVIKPTVKPAAPTQRRTENQPKPSPAPKKDSVVTPVKPVVVERPAPALPKPVIPEVPVKTRSRENNLTRTFDVVSEEIEIRLYDNGEIDGDTISVYHNGKLVVSSQMLSTKPISIKLKMDELHPEHVLVMVAENLGRIPPNTSVMVVQDGERNQKVSITSTDQKNAMVRFRYKKP